MSEPLLPYRRALVTGASSGLGRALAKVLAECGTEVVLSARRQEELESVAREIEERGGTARVQVLDVADADAAVASIRQLDQDVGGIDLVVANAGLGSPRRTDAMHWEKVRKILQVNFTGAIATLMALVPTMLERGKGHLVGISSLAALGPLPGGVASYGASKAGLSAFLEALRMDLGGSGIAATAVHAGFLKTPMTAKVRHAMPQAWQAERAARYIVARLPARPARIDFPEPLASATRLGMGLPRPLRALVLGRQRPRRR